MQLSWSRADGAIVLSGDIDEKCAFDALLDDVKDGTVLDLSRVERINSVGVRLWLGFIQAIEAKGCALTMRGCSVAVVQQLNIIARFAGAARITSIHAPFLCPQCDTSATKVVTLGGDIEPQLHHACPNCKTPMEFDDIPQAYFAFRRR